MGFRPDPWAWSGWEWATDGRFPGRWDDLHRNFRTVYTGSGLQACLLEVLGWLQRRRDLHRRCTLRRGPFAFRSDCSHHQTGRCRQSDRGNSVWRLPSGLETDYRLGHEANHPPGRQRCAQPKASAG
ncbi:RES domain-containing protein [Arthrobacter sp.]|uniref:RES domain-containing protein n=1 Tax=Arthrobacter sp. TaxID=1667 RepID=UPI00339AB9EC